MNKNTLYAVLATVLMGAIPAHAEQVNRFLGSHLGGMMGINDSKASGAVSAPIERTIAYLIQAGYVQGGYNWKFGKVIGGIGGYADMHGYEKHSNGLAYGSLAAGMHAKVAYPMVEWLPYAKFGYGYGSGTDALHSVKGYGFNRAIGVEYQVEPRWSVLAEFKLNIIRGEKSEIDNRTFMFGFTYYYDKPVDSKDLEAEVEEIDLNVAPEVVPDVAPEFAPAP